MGTIIMILLGVAVFAAVVSYIFTDTSDPKERAAEAGAAALGGAWVAGSCMLQAVILGGLALFGLWLISKIFG